MAPLLVTLLGAAAAPGEWVFSCVVENLYDPAQKVRLWCVTNWEARTTALGYDSGTFF